LKPVKGNPSESMGRKAAALSLTGVVEGLPGESRVRVIESLGGF